MEYLVTNSNSNELTRCFIEVCNVEGCGVQNSCINNCSSQCMANIHCLKDTPDCPLFMTDKSIS